jgi:fimbrial chaperone protein
MKILACLALTLWSVPAWALRISPSVATLSPSGPGAARDLRLENDTGRVATFRVEALTSAIDIDGDETTIPVKSLRVVPAQLTLEPHQVRTLHVTWAGDPHPGKELAFRIIVSESGGGKHVPGIDLASVTRYEALAYVAPPGAAPAVTIDSLRVLPDGKGELVLSNSGTAHQALAGMHLQVKRTVSGNQQESTDFHPALPKEPGTDSLPPASVRRFVIELPKRLAAIPGPLHADLAFR